MKGLQGQVEVEKKDGIKKWTERAKPLLDASREVFGYFSKYYSGYSSNDEKELLSFIGA